MSAVIAYLIIGLIFFIGLILDGDSTKDRLLLLGAGVFLVLFWPVCIPSIIRLNSLRSRAQDKIKLKRE